MRRTPDGPAAGEGDAWLPQSLLASRPAWPSARWRVALLAGVVIAHLLGLHWLSGLAGARRAAGPDEVLIVDFIQDPLPPPPPVPDRAEPDTEREPEPLPGPRKRPRRSLQVPLQALPAPAPAPRTARLELYGADGRLKVPDDMLEQIDRKFGDKRDFSYQIPRIDDARKLLERPPPVTYETTRFAQYWKPDQDLLTDLLTKMVEKTTREIRVPVPGSNGTSTMVCRVSLLALGGGCGVLTNGSDYVGPLDDPDTLSPEEDRQCAAWWEQIVGASTQEAWRKTRDLYEEQCRKPRARVPAG